MKHILYASTAILLASLPLTGTASADVLITCDFGPVAGTPGFLGCLKGSAEAGLNNILFSDPKAIDGTVAGPLPTLVGITDPAHGTQATAFSFHSETDLLHIDNGSGGAASIIASDGIINNLSYFVTANQTPFYGSTYNAFTVLDTNLDTIHADGTAQFVISAQDSLGNLETFNSTTFNLTNGQNKFQFVAFNGEVITNVTLTSGGVTGVEVLEVKQNQVTLSNTPGSVPEPTSMLILGSGLLGLGLVRRMYKKG